MRTTPLPWEHEPCPPAPLVLLGELALPPGSRPQLVQVLGDVHSTATAVTVSQRALALALCTPAAQGVLVRDSAVWVWTGDPTFVPSRVDLATSPSAPPLPGPRPAGRRTGLAVRAVRWDPAQTWTTVLGVPLTDPVTTAVACARLLPVDRAHRRLEALARCGGFDAGEALQRLRPARGRPGHAQAVHLLQQVDAARADAPVSHR